MRRLIVPLAGVAVLALGVVLGLSLLAAGEPATPGARAAALAAELRCPDCQSLSVAESRTAAAAAIRAQIGEQLAAGRSVEEVRQYFVDRYGEWILLEPGGALPLLVPVAALLVGIGLLAWWLRRRPAPTVEPAARQPSPAAPAAPAPPPSAAELERIRDEVEALDA